MAEHNHKKGGAPVRDEDAPHSCANSPCQCDARAGDAYCSEYCRHAATSGPPRVEPVCRCGHDGCG